MSLESTKMSIRKLQMKFLLRAQNNDFVRNFIDESRKICNNEGMIGKLIMDEGWKYNSTLVELNKCIETKLFDINMNVIDAYFCNEEAQSVKTILSIRNGFLKTYKLNQLLHYSTYKKTDISEEMLARIKTWSRN